MMQRSFSRFSRVLAVLLAAVLMPVSLFGCGLNKMPDKQTLTHVYRATEIPMPAENSYVNSFDVRGDVLVFTTNYWDETKNESVEQTFEVKLDGTGLTETTPPKSDKEEEADTEQNYYDIADEALPDGTRWVAQCHYSVDEVTYNYKESFVFLHLAADGTEIARFTGEDLWGVPKEGEYYYVNRFNVLDSGELIISSGETLYTVRDEGKTIRKTDITSLSETGYVENIFPVGGTLYLLSYEWSGVSGVYSLIPLSLETGALGTPIRLTDDAFQNVYATFPGDESYTFYFMTEEYVYGCTASAESVTVEPLLNFLNSDLNFSIGYNMKIVSPDKFVTYGYDSMTEEQAIYVLDRVPEDQLVPKWVITLGTLESDWAVRNHVIRFNRQSDEYRINLVTYKLDYDPSTGESYDYDTLMEAAVTQLNNDMLAGRGPDILLTSPFMPVDSYIAKGLFVDLYSFIDKDEELSREDFLPNVLSALEVNGSLYEVMPTFTVRTMAGKTSLLGDRTAWTMDEFAKFAASLPEGRAMFFEMTRDTALEMFLAHTYEEFIDPETGECRFDTGAFGQLLTFLKTMPEKLDEERMNSEEYWMEYDNRFREDKAVLEQTYLSGFSSLPSLMNHTFYTDEITLIGAPTEGSCGGSIAAGDLSFAISVKSRLKDASWEFVRYFLTAEYQDAQNFNFPMRADSLDKMMEDAIRQAEEEKKWVEEMQQGGGDYAIDDDMAVDTMPAVGKEVIGMPAPPRPIGQTYYLTREMAEEIRDYVKQTDRIVRQNPSITNIIKEDAAAFFAGKKSLEETVKLIQNRVGTVVAEGR